MFQKDRNINRSPQPFPLSLALSILNENSYFHYTITFRCNSQVNFAGQFTKQQPAERGKHKIRNLALLLILCSFSSDIGQPWASHFNMIQG